MSTVCGCLAWFEAQPKAVGQTLARQVGVTRAIEPTGASDRSRGDGRTRSIATLRADLAVGCVGAEQSCLAVDLVVAPVCGLASSGFLAEPAQAILSGGAVAFSGARAKGRVDRHAIGLVGKALAGQPLRAECVVGAGENAAFGFMGYGQAGS